MLPQMVSPSGRRSYWSLSIPAQRFCTRARFLKSLISSLSMCRSIRETIRISASCRASFLWPPSNSGQKISRATSPSSFCRISFSAFWAFLFTNTFFNIRSAPGNALRFWPEHVLSNQGREGQPRPGNSRPAPGSRPREKNPAARRRGFERTGCLFRGQAPKGVLPGQVGYRGRPPFTCPPPWPSTW